MRARLVALAVAAAVLLSATALPQAAAKKDEAERFEVLQASFHLLTDMGTTRQSLSERCVLMEQHAEGDTEQTEDARAAAAALLANTTRREFVYAELDENETRFESYYRATPTNVSPLAIVDGLARVGGGGPQAQPHAEVTYHEAGRVAPRASINVSSNIVVQTGHLDYEVFIPEAFVNYTLSVRAFLVEDNATSDAGIANLRYLVRVYIPGAYLGPVNESSIAGRFNFTLEPAWVQSRMAAVVFVQVDLPPAVPHTDPPADYPWVFVVFAATAAATAAALVLLMWRLVRAERRKKSR